MTGGPNPSGLCCCGCGAKTSIASQTRTARGVKKGQHYRFAAHHGKGRVNPLQSVDRDGPGGCWLWLANKHRTGYGVFHRRNQALLTTATSRVPRIG
jgi:hypothetical protein